MQRVLSKIVLLGGKQIEFICSLNSTGSANIIIATSFSRLRLLNFSWTIISATEKSCCGNNSFLVCVSHSPRRSLKSLAFKLETQWAAGNRII